MNAETKIRADYRHCQTRAEWERDTRLRELRETFARLRQRLAAKQDMLENRIMRDFEAGRFDHAR